MQKTIKISVNNIKYLYSRYNQKAISNDLINYIIYVANHFKAQDKIKIVFEIHSLNDKFKSELRESLKNNYLHLKHEYQRNNLRQFIYLLIGIGILWIALLIHNNELFEEIFVISGWVLIWKMVEIELFIDTENRRRRHILKRLLSSEIVVKNKIDDDIL